MTSWHQPDDSINPQLTPPRKNRPKPMVSRGFLDPKPHNAPLPFPGSSGVTDFTPTQRSLTTEITCGGSSEVFLFAGWYNGTLLFFCWGQKILGVSVMVKSVFFFVVCLGVLLSCSKKPSAQFSRIRNHRACKLRLPDVLRRSRFLQRNGKGQLTWQPLLRLQGGPQRSVLRCPLED